MTIAPEPHPFVEPSVGSACINCGLSQSARWHWNLPAESPAGEAHTERNTAMTTPLLSGDTLSALLPDTTAPVDESGPDAELLRRTGETVAVLAQKIDDLTAQRDAAQQAAEANRFRLEEFQSQVRDVAIRVAEERDWCDQGLNEVLAELGLDPKETEWEVTVTVTAHVQKVITVTAGDEDDAREKVRTDDEDCVSDQIESGDFDWDDDDIEIDGVDRP